MRLRMRPMLPNDVNDCVALIASQPEERRRYGTLLDQLSSVWLKLLGEGSLTSTVVEDTGGGTPQIVACGACVFVTQEFMNRLKTAPLVWFGPELVRRVAAGDGCILGPKAIRAANSSEGLNLVVWTGVTNPPRPEDVSPLRAALLRDFIEGHSGYRLKEFVSQTFDPESIPSVLNTGGLLWQAADGGYVDGRSAPIAEFNGNPFIVGWERKLCYEKGGGIGAWSSLLFAYTPPNIYFRPAEQCLLLAALRGLTDDQLADEIGISLTAVKKTWRRVYERASGALPHELPIAANVDLETKRGKEKKQYLLAYLRQHMEELRPVLPPRPKTIAGKDGTRRR